jgi:hypothetical protein
VCHLQIDADPVPDLAYHFDAVSDPDSAYYFDAEGIQILPFNLVQILADPDPQHF